MLCHDYTTSCTFIWLRQPFLSPFDVFLESKKKNVASLSGLFFQYWAIVGNCCESFLHFVGGVPPLCRRAFDASLGFRETISGLHVFKRFHTSLQTGIHVNLILASALTFYSPVCFVCACSEGNAQLKSRWIFTVCSHTSDHFTHPPPFCLSVVEQRRPFFWALRKSKTLMLLTNSLA